MRSRGCWGAVGSGAAAEARSLVNGCTIRKQKRSHTYTLPKNDFLCHCLTWPPLERHFLQGHCGDNVVSFGCLHVVYPRTDTKLRLEIRILPRAPPPLRGDVEIWTHSLLSTTLTNSVASSQLCQKEIMKGVVDPSFLGC